VIDAILWTVSVRVGSDGSQTPLTDACSFDERDRQHNWQMVGRLARKVLAVPVGTDGRPLRGYQHLSRGTPIDVLRQRPEDSRVEIRLARGQDERVYLVPADAIDRATARVISVHRPPRHRRASGGSYVQVDWKGLGKGHNRADLPAIDRESEIE